CQLEHLHLVRMPVSSAKEDSCIHCRAQGKVFPPAGRRLLSLTESSGSRKTLYLGGFMINPRNGLMAAWVKMVSFLSVQNDHISKRLAKNVFNYRRKAMPPDDAVLKFTPRVVCTIQENLVVWEFHG
ncbi:hypothetical protein OW715_12595, partial [Acidithiobacillus ferriphilus]